MLKATPDVRRQLPDAGPAILWRARAGGGREGLVLAADACANAGCPCREITIQGWRVNDGLTSASVDGGTARFVYKAGLDASSPLVLTTRLNVDTAKLGAVEGAPTSTPWAVEWFRSEVDSELLAFLQRRFSAAKTQSVRPDWRTEDWSWWKPGMEVGWLDLHLDAGPLEVAVGGRTYAFWDRYCVVPGCTCEEVRWRVTRADAGDAELGEVSVNPKYPTAAQLWAHGAAREELVTAWAALGEREPLPGLMFARRDEMRGASAELHRLFGARRAPKGKVGRNAPCPCGSGKKFKQCCMEA